MSGYQIVGIEGTFSEDAWSLCGDAIVAKGDIVINPDTKVRTSRRVLEKRVAKNEVTLLDSPFCVSERTAFSALKVCRLRCFAPVSLVIDKLLQEPPSWFHTALRIQQGLFPTTYFLAFKNKKHLKRFTDYVNETIFILISRHLFPKGSPMPSGAFAYLVSLGMGLDPTYPEFLAAKAYVYCGNKEAIMQYKKGTVGEGAHIFDCTIKYLEQNNFRVGLPSEYLVQGD